MKKVLFSLLLFFAAVFYAPAQVNPHAIGLRFGGGGDVLGGEISYQHGLGSTNRLELDLGLGSGNSWSRTDLTGIYQWDWNLTDGLNWFVGPGATIGLWKPSNNSGYFNIGVGGQIGLEYDFKKVGAPILLSLDTRPMWNLTGSGSGFGWGAALGVRYVW